MHSSIINKIRILKPRKRPNANTRSFTITNTNCHSSINPKDAEDDPPPPLIPQTSASSDSEKPPENQWVPVYILDVPKVVKDNEVNVLASQKLPPAEKSNQSTLSSVSLSTSNKIQVSKDSEAISSCSKVGDRSVSCFLCPSKFGTVQAMQDHYLENHKKSKRVLGFKKNGKSTPDQMGESDTADEGEPKCPICSIGFKTKEEVQEHMGSVHCYDCSECKNTFYTLFQFTDHKCVKVIRPKRKIKKKKVIRIVEKDPLAIYPNEKELFSKSVSVQTKISEPPKNVPFPVSTKMQVNIPYVSAQPSHPLVIAMPQSISSSLGTFPTTFIISKNHQSDPLKLSNVYTAPVPSLGSNWTQNAPQIKKSSDMAHYTLEELTSKEVIKKKLDEILNNPSISLERISKENSEANQEYFSCGRCNVLCEDKADFLDHLEECLRLSNVSISPSGGTAERILKLRSELISSKAFNLLGKKTSINKSLIKELKNFIGQSDVLDSLNKLESSVQVQEENSQNGNLGDAKLNESVSIKRVARPKDAVMEEQNKRTAFVMNSSDPLLVHSNNGRQPMVIIPINKEGNSIVAFKEKKPPKNDDSDDHYPDISITDKSNSVTYKFAGSTVEPLLSNVHPQQAFALQGNHNKVQKQFLVQQAPNLVQEQGTIPTSSYRVKTKKVFIPVLQVGSNPRAPPPVAAAMEETSKPADDLFDPHFELKEEPLSPRLDCVDSKSDGNLDLVKSEFSHSAPIELVLDNEDIKMEVEDEVVDDEF